MRPRRAPTYVRLSPLQPGRRAARSRTPWWLLGVAGTIALLAAAITVAGWPAL